MNEYEPTSPQQTLSSDAESAKGSEPTVGPAAMAEPGRRPKVRRSLSHMKRGVIVAAALMFSATGLTVGLGASSSAGAAQTVAAISSTGHLGSGGQGSNARSGPAAGGSSGTVTSVSASGFTLTTSAGQVVTIDESSSTNYEKGTASTSKSAITKGTHVLVLGTVSSTTIKATQVIVQSSGGSAPSTAAAVVPFQKGTAGVSKQVGQIPTSYTEGSGTIVSGTTANKATEAALTAYPGGVVDRVVKLSNGEYEVHTIGVNWPHHVFVNQDFKVIGAD
jgi:hypothetical protein